MSTNSSLHQMMQRMTNSEVDRVVKAKLKADMSQAAEKALTNFPSTGYRATSGGLKHTSNKIIENTTTEMTLKETFDDLFLRSLERWSQAPTSVDVSSQMVLKSRSITSSLTTSIKKRMDNTVDELRLTPKEEARHTKLQIDPIAPPSPPTTSSSDDV